MESRISSKHIAIFLPSLRGGGAERVMVTLANAFAENGHRVDLILAKAEGPYLTEVSKKVRVIDLNASRVLRSFWPLCRYLRDERPDTMLSALNYANIIAIFARQLARATTYLAVSERSSLMLKPKRPTAKLIRGLMRWSYPKADKVISVSKGIEADIYRLVGVPKEKIETIYNPVDLEAIKELCLEPLCHPWLDHRSAPVILAVGRLTAAKDYPTLLRAFALLRKDRDVRLIILGEGEEAANLKALAQNLNIYEDLDFVGFQPNPFAWMARCDLFVMSSAWEGFPNVLVQAMACGAPVVSTSCRTGPDEILENGRWGRLTPVGDSNSLCTAMAHTLDEEAPPNGRIRAAELNVPRILAQYANAILR